MNDLNLVDEIPDTEIKIGALIKYTDGYATIKHIDYRSEKNIYCLHCEHLCDNNWETFPYLSEHAYLLYKVDDSAFTNVTIFTMEEFFKLTPIKNGTKIFDEASRRSADINENYGKIVDLVEQMLN